MDSNSPPPTTTSTYQYHKPPFLVVLNAALMLLGSDGSLLLHLYFVCGGPACGSLPSSKSQPHPSSSFPSPSPSYSSQPSSPSPPTAIAASSSSLGPSAPPLPSSASLSPSIATSIPTALPTSHSRPPPSSWPLRYVFTAIFAFLMVRQRFTPFSPNFVVLLTLGPVVLSLGRGGDRPEGEPRSRYYLGFFMTVAAAALVGLVLSLVEVAYQRTREEITYAMIIETQIVMGASGTPFCLLGMLVNKDFHVHAPQLFSLVM